ncbi:MAG: hydroxymethylbilane synthase [Flavobacteriales bacterium]|jgi:hydroxymethylbilane synthase|tara:strand:- start:74 stop:964 length:891 start_codon:yes stop_codon:yes gene_type:complete
MHIKIGTRKSKLALWQAYHVEEKLKHLGHTTEIVKMVSEGDKVLDTPLPLMGGKGVFTKVLDDALLEEKVDIAVHSFKDIPTETDELLQVSSILEREDPLDALVCRDNLDFLQNENATIATSSTRRKAQWLSKYPNHTIVDIRGNVPTRIEKLKNSDWDATILACAGLIRLDLQKEIDQSLDWMIGAPAQGAVAIMSLKKNVELNKVLESVNDQDTAMCTNIERDFLNRLNGGCSSPVGAYAYIENDQIFFTAIALNENGSDEIRIELCENVEDGKDLGVKAAKIAINQGAQNLIK